MNVKIFYYSFTGNTQRVAQELKEFLSQKGHRVVLEKIVSLDEPSSFFKQGMRAFLKKTGQIAPLDFGNLQDFDCLGLGFPVWALSFPPGVRGFLKEIPPLAGRKFFVFATFGSGLGQTKALDEAEDSLKSKGAQVVGKISIPSSKIEGKEWLASQFEELYKIIAV